MFSLKTKRTELASTTFRSINFCPLLPLPSPTDTKESIHCWWCYLSNRKKGFSETFWKLSQYRNAGTIGITRFKIFYFSLIITQTIIRWPLFIATSNQPCLSFHFSGDLLLKSANWRLFLKFCHSLTHCWLLLNFLFIINPTFL